MAEQVGYASPYRLQHLLGRAIWDEEQMCAEVRDYVVAHLMMEQESGRRRNQLPWKRRISWGGRQYCGQRGRENCQVGVFRLHQLERVELD